MRFLRTKRQHIRSEAACWVVRLSEADSPAARAQLDAWMRESVVHAEEFLAMSMLWVELDRLSTSAAAAGPDRIAARTPRAWRALWPPAMGFVGVAAVVVLATFAVFALRWWSTLSAATHDTYVTALGETRNLRLDDGSTLHLNTDTKVRVDYGHDHRRIELDRGEALFDVQPDAARPFVVDTDGRLVKVLGTKFSVRLFEDEAVDVAVSEGSVYLQRAAHEPGVPVSANELGKVRGDQVSTVPLQPAEIARRQAWIDGRIVLDGTKVSDAVAAFNRYNEVKLVIRDASVADYRIGGAFSMRQPDSFAYALETLHLAKAVRARNAKGEDILLLEEAPR